MGKHADSTPSMHLLTNLSSPMPKSCSEVRQSVRYASFRLTVCNWVRDVGVRQEITFSCTELESCKYYSVEKKNDPLYAFFLPLSLFLFLSPFFLFVLYMVRQ